MDAYFDIEAAKRDRIGVLFRKESQSELEEYFEEEGFTFVTEDVSDAAVRFIFLEEDRGRLAHYIDLSKSTKIPAEGKVSEGKRDALDGKIDSAENKRDMPYRPAARATPTRNYTVADNNLSNGRPTQRPLNGANDTPKTTAQNPPKWSAQDLVKDLGVLSVEEQKRIEEQKKKATEEQKPKKERVKTGRDNQVKTRLTDTEMILFSDRVKASGMKQGDFMRECLLHEEVNVRSLTEIDAKAFGLLMEMASDLGRIGGLIKGTVVANKDEFSILTAENKEKLEQEIRELNRLKEDIMKVVSDLYGNS